LERRAKRDHGDKFSEHLLNSAKEHLGDIFENWLEAEDYETEDGIAMAAWEFLKMEYDMYPEMEAIKLLNCMADDCLS
jgi:hypothetical protein